MANHTDDCPNCGQDRRGYVRGACCKKEETRQKRERADFRAEQEQHRALLEKHGISWSQRPASLPDGEWEVVAVPKSLFAFLESLP